MKTIMECYGNCFYLFTTHSLLGAHGQGIDREIFLNIKTGVEAKNYDDVSCFCLLFYSIQQTTSNIGLTFFTYS